MQPVNRLYIRGVKVQTLLVAAAAAAVALAGCSGNTSSPSTSAAPSAGAADSWQNWGREGEQKLNRCDKTEFGCVHDQLSALIIEGKKLPQHDKAGFAAMFLATLYQGQYSDYVTKSCGQGSVVDGCMKIATSMLSIDNDLRPVVNHLAAGTAADSEVQKTIDDINNGRPAN